MRIRIDTDTYIHTYACAYANKKAHPIPVSLLGGGSELSF